MYQKIEEVAGLDLRSVSTSDGCYGCKSHGYRRKVEESVEYSRDIKNGLTVGYIEYREANRSCRGYGARV